MLITGGENEDIFCVCTSSTSDGRFLTGAEQGSMMNRGDGILEPTNLPYGGENGGVFFLEYW